MPFFASKYLTLLFSELVPTLSRLMWYRVWHEDMDIAKETSLVMLGVKAGLTEEQAVDCLEVRKVLQNIYFSMFSKYF